MRCWRRPTGRCWRPPPISAARALQAFWLVTFPLSLPGVGAGLLLCFIPIIGEFVIPDLLAGSDSLMIGQTLWAEFFTNKDWPLASALAVVLLCVLLVPLLIYEKCNAQQLEERPVMHALHGSSLVQHRLAGASVWRFSICRSSFSSSIRSTIRASSRCGAAGRCAGIVELFRDQAMIDAAWMSLRVAFVSATLATVLGTLRRGCAVARSGVSAAARCSPA